MVGLLVRLRWTMFRTALRRSTIQLVSAIVGGVFAVGSAMVAVPILIALRVQPVTLTAVTVPLFTGLTLAWGVLSIAATGIDNGLDPARFAVLPVRARDLARGTLAASVVGIPVPLLLTLALGQVGAWTAAPIPALGAAVAAVLGSLTAVLFARSLTQALAAVMTSRRGRELGAVVISMVTLAPIALNAWLVGRHGTQPLGLDPESVAGADLTGYADLAGWTPWGWAWALPLDLARGRWASAVLHLVLALAFVALLWRSWIASLGRALTAPLIRAGGQRIRPHRLLDGLSARGPVRAVGVRRLRAWRRDSRLVSVAVRTALLPVFFILQQLFLGGEGTASAGLVLLAVFAGLSLMNDLAFDGPAWWLHLATGLPGAADRWGRVLASLAVFGPALVGGFILCVGLGIITSPVRWAAVLLVAFLAGLAVATVVGAWVPGTAPRTGGNPFAAPAGGAAQGCVTAVIALVVPLALSAPIVLAAYAVPPGPWPWVVLVLSGLWGSGLLVGAVRLGGRRLDRRGPEMLDQLRSVQV